MDTTSRQRPYGELWLACEVDGGGREMVYSKTNQKEALEGS